MLTAYERICVYDGCTAQLSRYNHSEACARHEGCMVDVSRHSTGRLIDFGGRHAETRTWTGELFVAKTKSGRGLCSMPGCRAPAAWAWNEQRREILPHGWRAFCDDHLPYTADQLTADAHLNSLCARLHVAEARQRERIFAETLAAKGLTWPPLDRYPICVACEQQVHHHEGQVRLLSPGQGPTTVHAKCTTGDVLTAAGFLRPAVA